MRKMTSSPSLNICPSVPPEVRNSWTPPFWATSRMPDFTWIASGLSRSSMPALAAARIWAACRCPMSIARLVSKNPRGRSLPPVRVAKVPALTIWFSVNGSVARLNIRWPSTSLSPSCLSIWSYSSIVASFS